MSAVVWMRDLIPCYHKHTIKTNMKRMCIRKCSRLFENSMNNKLHSCSKFYKIAHQTHKRDDDRPCSCYCSRTNWRTDRRARGRARFVGAGGRFSVVYYASVLYSFVWCGNTKKNDTNQGRDEIAMIIAHHSNLLRLLENVVNSLRRAVQHYVWLGGIFYLLQEWPGTE